MKEVPIPQYVEKPTPEYVNVEAPFDVDRNIPIPVEAVITFEYQLVSPQIYVPSRCCFRCVFILLGKVPTTCYDGAVPTLCTSFY